MAARSARHRWRHETCLQREDALPPPPRFPPVVALVALVALAALACGGSAPDAPDAGSPDAGTPPSPAVTFFDVSGTTPVAVTRMLWANALDVRVTGLDPVAQITVTARFTGWGASATFDADANGVVDLATAAPEPGGSYEGVDPDGIVWSMTPSTSPPWSVLPVRPDGPMDFANFRARPR